MSREDSRQRLVMRNLCSFFQDVGILSGDYRDGCKFPPLLTSTRAARPCKLASWLKYSQNRVFADTGPVWLTTNSAPSSNGYAEFRT